MQDLDDGGGTENDLAGAKGGGIGGPAPILKDVDGVVAVGGDGLVSELAHGLILAAAHSAGVDVNDPTNSFSPTPLRLGVIPGKTLA